MIFEKIQEFEYFLKDNGYKKITSSKAESRDDYEWYKAFRNNKGELLYQIFFCFWNFEQYRIRTGWSVSVIIMPESCIDNVGRRDLQLSVDWSTNLTKVEQAAKMFYKTIRKIDVL